MRRGAEESCIGGSIGGRWRATRGKRVSAAVCSLLGSAAVTEAPASSPLALLGVGYIGGSLALAARQAGLTARIVGHDVDAGAVSLARARGVIDEAAATPE